METEKIKQTKIADLVITEDKKGILSYLGTPRTIAEVAAKFDCSYTQAYQVLAVWEAKGWVKKYESLGGGKCKFVLNLDVLGL